MGSVPENLKANVKTIPDGNYPVLHFIGDDLIYYVVGYFDLHYCC